jgi:hypothetical protein
MTSPLDPNQEPSSPDPLVPSTPAATPERPEHSAAFARSLGGSMGIRVAVVAVAAIVLLISAALTFAASPSPSAGTDNGTPNVEPPFGNGPLGNGPLGNGPLGPRGGGFGGLLDRLDDLKDRHGFGRITIAAIDGSNIALKTDDGWTRTIAVTSDTKITKGGQAIAVGDLRVGDQVRFRETRNADGTFTIQAINVVLPSVAGEVTAVNGDTFTVKSRSNVTWTITTNNATKYMLDGGDGEKSDVKVGARVGVVGTQSGESALTATTVRIAPAVVAGKVTAKTSDTITIQRVGGGTVTLHVNASTKYHVRGKDNASLSDINVGDGIVAAGRQRSDGSIDAVAIGAGRGKLGRGFGSGQPKNAPDEDPTAPNATPGSYSAG